MVTRRVDALCATVISSNILCATTCSAVSITATNLSASNVSAGILSGTNIYGVTISADNSIASACGTSLTYHGPSSACMLNENGLISADRFLIVTINGTPYYIPAYVSAGAGTAI